MADTDTGETIITWICTGCDHASALRTDQDTSGGRRVHMTCPGGRGEVVPAVLPVYRNDLGWLYALTADGRHVPVG